MAKTFSKSVNALIECNSKSKHATFLCEMVANNAMLDMMSAFRAAIVEFCPHKEVCTSRHSRRGCTDCSYLNKYVNRIKSDPMFCFTQNQ